MWGGKPDKLGACLWFVACPPPTLPLPLQIRHLTSELFAVTMREVDAMRRAVEAEQRAESAEEYRDLLMAKVCACV